MFHIRAAHDGDTHYLLDIDIKCFEIAWTPDEWRMVTTKHHVAVATNYGTPIGFVVFRETLGCIEVPKLAVKRQYRRQRVAEALLYAVDGFAKSRGVRRMTMLVPEYLTDPETPGAVGGWLNRAGFRTDSPFIEEAFYICGEPENGILFEREIQC